MSLSLSNPERFWKMVEIDLNFKSWLKSLREFILEDFPLKYRQFEEELINCLKDLQKMTNLHKFIIDVIIKLREFPNELEERKKRIYKGNVLNLYGRYILIQLEKMEFKNIVSLNKIFNNYLNDQNHGKDLFKLLDDNTFFIIQDNLRDFYEQNKSSEPHFFYEKISSLNIKENLKNSLKENYDQQNYKFLQCLKTIHQKEHWEDLNKFDKDLHFFIDSKIFEYFPSNVQQNTQPDLIQQAVLLKAFLNLFRNNLEEAEICFNDCIRFAQINKDDQTINTGLSFLVLIYTIQENFEKKFKTLKDFHSLNLNNKNPLLVFYNTLYFLDMDIQFDPYSFKGLSELEKNRTLQMNQIENLHFSIKKISKYLQDNYFNKDNKFFCAKNNSNYFKEIMFLKFFDTFQDYYKNFDFISQTDINFERPCKTFFKQNVVFNHLLFLLDENIDQFSQMTQQLHSSYFKYNQKQLEFYACFLAGKLFLKFEDAVSSQNFYEKAKKIHTIFQNPLQKHYLDLWHFQILLQKKSYKKLDDLLKKKLNQFLQIGYTKTLFYSFFMIHIEVLYQLRNYQAILKDIRDHYHKVKQFNLFKTFYQFRIYEQKCQFQLGELKVCQNLIDQNSIFLIRAPSFVQADYYYELLVLKVQQFFKTKNQSLLVEINQILVLLKNKCLLILDIKLLKKTFFLESLIQNKMKNEEQKQISSKIVIQFDYLKKYMEDISKILIASDNILIDTLNLIDGMHDLVEDIIFNY